MMFLIIIDLFISFHVVSCLCFSSHFFYGIQIFYLKTRFGSFCTDVPLNAPLSATYTDYTRANTTCDSGLPCTGTRPTESRRERAEPTDSDGTPKCIIMFHAIVQWFSSNHPPRQNISVFFLHKFASISPYTSDSWLVCMPRRL